MATINNIPQFVVYIIFTVLSIIVSTVMLIWYRNSHHINISKEQIKLAGYNYLRDTEFKTSELA